MQSCFSIFSGGLLLFLPDTPRWYYARDRHEEGDKTLARLHGKDVNDEAVQTMRREILASLHVSWAGPKLPPGDVSDNHCRKTTGKRASSIS